MFMNISNIFSCKLVTCQLVTKDTEVLETMLVAFGRLIDSTSSKKSIRSTGLEVGRSGPRSLIKVRAANSTKNYKRLFGKNPR